METFLSFLSLCSALIWLIILLLPWRPWLNGETLEPESSGCDLGDLTVLIPARNEAEFIAATLQGLAGQGRGLKIVLVDDGSDDGTAQIAAQVAGIDLTLVEGKPLPVGWSGKLWALQQGFDEVRTPWVLLLDADILLAPGMAAALLDKARKDGCRFVSIMASLRMESFWEKLLMPAFIYFFKLLYPFRMVNSAHRAFSAAAGGCILLETRLLRELGGFAAIKNQVIDDCSLARKIKQAGHRIWVGQSHSVISQRRYEALEPIWEMVARTAFTQLRYSAWLLGLCTLLMGVMFWGPIGLLGGCDKTQVWSIAAYAGMMMTYWPTLRYYGKSPHWAGLMPLIATFYLAMTWTSALRYWRQQFSFWRLSAKVAEST